MEILRFNRRSFQRISRNCDRRAIEKLNERGRKPRLDSLKQRIHEKGRDLCRELNFIPGAGSTVCLI